MTYDLFKTQKLVKNCLKIFMKNDIFLLEVDADERAISHKLACYLQSEISEMHVDCEYNRDEFEIKKISDEKGSKPRRIYPDIIVHKRGENCNNILVVEIKKQENREIENDEIKLKEFTSGSYGYHFGLLIIFNTKENSKNRPILRWFSNGRELKL